MTRRALLLGVVVLVAAVASTAATAAPTTGPDMHDRPNRPAVDLDEVVQQDAQPNSSANGSDSGSSSVVAQVDSTVVVTSYRYNASSETFFVTLRNDEQADEKSVTITEIIDRDAAGSRKFGISVVEVDGGETVTAEVSAARVDGAAGVMVLTNEAIETGAGVYLQESKQTDRRLIKGDPQGSHVRSGILASGFGSLMLVLMGAWQYVATSNSEEVEPSFDPHITLFGKIWRWKK